MGSRQLYALLLIACTNVLFTHQHAYLSDPPSRASAWLVDEDFVDCCKNYNYNQMFCGGFSKQWNENGGKCGICGDSWDEPKEYERGGAKYLGKIVKNYPKGTNLPVTVQITANHEGFFEFRICNVDGWETEATQECLNKTSLNVVGTNSPKFHVTKDMHTVKYELSLPSDLTCNHCVLQWKYVTGNSWGFDPVRNVSCVGCGPVQENFIGCSDISIYDPAIPTTTTTRGPRTTKPRSTASSSSSSSSSSSHSHNHEASTTKQIASSTVPVTNEPNKKVVCKPKLEFGTMINLINEITYYCKSMCELRCDAIIAHVLKETNENLIMSDRNYKACTQTCPAICSCN